MAIRNPRLRDVDTARVVLASGHSFRAIAKVLAGQHVHPTTYARIQAALAELGLPPPPPPPSPPAPAVPTAPEAA